MSTFIDGVVRDFDGVPVAGASVYVYGADGGLASLVDGSDAPLANPLASDALGYWSAHLSDSYWTVKEYWAGRPRRIESVREAEPDTTLRTDLATSGTSLIGIGGGASLADAIKVNLARFGLREAGSAASKLAAFTDAIGEYGGRAHPVTLISPQGTYDFGGADIGIEAANVRLDGQGSTFIGARILSSPAAVNCAIKNLRLYHDTAQAVLTMNNLDRIVRGIEIIKFGDGDGYMAMFEGGGRLVGDMVARGGNGVFLEVEGGSLHLDVVGRPHGGDDGAVLKARSRRSGDFHISGNFKNLSNGVAVGSEVGNLGDGGADTRPGRLENLTFDIVCTECTAGLNVKPGAIDVPAAPADYAWANGYVNGLVGRVKMQDRYGRKMERGLILSPARNALIENYDIAVFGEGRFASTSQPRAWAHVTMPDSTAYAAGGTGPGGIVGKGTIKVRGRDTLDGAADNKVAWGVGGAIANLPTQTVTVTAEPYSLKFIGTGSVTLSGAATGTLTGTAETEEVELQFTPSAGSLTLTVAGTVQYAVLQPTATPGLPCDHAVLVEKQNVAVGSADDINLDVVARGTKGGGIVVSEGLDNAVTIERFEGDAICNAPPSTQGGITAASILRAPGRNVIRMANASYKPIFLSGTGDVIGRREMMNLTGAAGVEVAAYRFFDIGVWLRKGSAVSHAGVGAVSSDYLTLELRALSGNRSDGTAVSGNAFGGFATNATAITANVPFDLGAFDNSGGAYDDRFLAAGSLLRAQKSNVGGGQQFQGTVFLDYVQIGEEG